MKFPMGQDTMCLAWLVNETQPKSLDALAAKYCGAVSWKAGIKSAEGSQEMADYGARDVYYTLALYEKLRELLGDRVKIADRIILPAFIALQECSKRGIYVSQARVAEFVRKYESEEVAGLAALQEYVGDIAPWCRNMKGVLAYKKPTKFNPGSPHQVSEWFRKSNILTRFTDSGDQSSDAKALEQAVLPPEFRRPLETYRHAKKMLSTYLEPLTNLGEDGRLHPEYYMFPRVFAGGGQSGGTASGRPTASDNVLTLPREMKRGGIYSAPPGKILAEADYGSIEFRLCAWYAGARGILDNYAQNPEWDAHSWFARPFYGMPDDAVVEKSKRQVGAHQVVTGRLRARLRDVARPDPRGRAVVEVRRSTRKRTWLHRNADRAQAQFWEMGTHTVRHARRRSARSGEPACPVLFRGSNMACAGELPCGEAADKPHMV